MITIENFSRQAQNVVACFFIVRNEAKHGRTKNNILS